MRIMEVKVYPFAELSKEAQENALNNLRDLNVDHDWWDYVYEDAERIGLKLTGFALYRNRHASGEFTEYAEIVAARIIEEHGPDCETRKTAEAYLEERERTIKENHADMEDEYCAHDLCQDIDTEFLRSLLEDYAIMLEKEYEYRTSDESIKESIESNEYEFTEDGKLV